jgi:hypothetical protein
MVLSYVSAAFCLLGIVAGAWLFYSVGLCLVTFGLVLAHRIISMSGRMDWRREGYY